MTLSDYNTLLSNNPSFTFGNAKIDDLISFESQNGKIIVYVKLTDPDIIQPNLTNHINFPNDIFDPFFDLLNSQENFDLFSHTPELFIIKHAQGTNIIKFTYELPLDNVYSENGDLVTQGRGVEWQISLT